MLPQPMPADPEEKFARNARRLREKRGLTQEEVAWASGIAQTTIARIESGERKPTLRTIFKLASGLGVRPSELFAGIR